jgi:hypothetical protein
LGCIWDKAENYYLMELPNKYNTISSLGFLTSEKDYIASSLFILSSIGGCVEKRFQKLFFLNGFDM